MLSGRDLIQGLRHTGTPEGVLEAGEKFLAGRPDATAAETRDALVSVLHRHGRRDDFVRENGTIRKADRIIAGEAPAALIADVKPPENNSEVRDERLAKSIAKALQDALPDIVGKVEGRMVERPESPGMPAKGKGSSRLAGV